MSKFSQAKSIFEEKKSSLSSPPQRNKRKYKKSTKTTKHCTTPKVIQIWKKTSDSTTLPKETIDHNFDRSGTSNETMCEKPRDSIKLVRKVTTQGSQPQRTPPTPPPPHPTTTTQPLTPPMPNTITLESFPNNSSGCESLQELFRNVDPPNGGTGLKVLPRPSVQDTTQVPPPPPTNQPLPTTIKCRTQEHRLQEKLDPQPLPPGNRTTGSTLPPPLTDLALPPITRITTNLQKNLLLRTVDPPVNEKLSRVAELMKKFGEKQVDVRESYETECLAKTTLPPLSLRRLQDQKEDNILTSLKPSHNLGSTSPTLFLPEDSYHTVMKTTNLFLEDDKSVLKARRQVGRQQERQGVPKTEDNRMIYNAELLLPLPGKKSPRKQLQRLLRQPFSPGNPPADELR